MKNFWPLAACLLASFFAKAQFPYRETFKNASSPGLVVSGSAKLTAAAGIDAVGDGYLRLTENTTNNVGYVYAQDSFPSNYGFTASFEFFSWKAGANSTNQADGMTFFLFDASVNAFRPGGSGGSLGYAQYYSTPGMAKGYIGISLDEFGNFSSASDGTKSGGPGQQRGSVAIRGPGNGKSATDYVYQTGVIASDPLYTAGFQGFTQRFPDSTQANYRRLKVVMTPGSSAGASIGYKITIIMYKGGIPVSPVTLINNYDYPFAAPSQLQFGLAASTGAISNYHEVRNLNIDVANTVNLLRPTLSSDNGIVACQGQQALLDVTANDLSNNVGGSINKASLDLDPSLTGRQTSFTDPGKGVYTVNENGVVSFTPIPGYSGSSSALYNVDDTYGLAAAAAATITVTVSSTTAPELSIVNPAAVCFPSTIDISNASWKTATSAGAGYTYFRTLTDANAGINALIGSATTINQPGTYYVRSTLSGCSTIKPIILTIGQLPTASNAGTDQNFCSSTGGQSSTLLANNPESGIGTWSQVSGPTTATITYADASTSPISNLSQGVYLFKWTIASQGCPSSVDDIQVSVGIASNAGSAQSLANASTTVLAANTPTPGIGLWSQISGPAISFANSSNPSTAVNGLVAGNSYTFSWKIINGGCTSTSQVVVSDVVNTIADAGPDQQVWSLLPFTLAGNTPAVGNTGTWSIVSKPAASLPTILLPNSPTAVVSSITSTGSYTLRWTVSNGGFSNYDEVTVTVGIPLPVRFISFTGRREGSANYLHWETATEWNSSHFEVEKSQDGIAFKKIGTVRSSASSFATRAYEFSDPFPTSEDQSDYYRIKQVDLDGSFSYTSVLRLAGQFRQKRVQVRNNPFNGPLALNVRTQFTEIIMLEIFHSSGRLMETKSYALSGGTSLIELGNTSGWSGGVYLLRVQSKNWEETVRLVKLP